MAYTGRCPYCGSEDVEEYSDGSSECMECGEMWNDVEYVDVYEPQQSYRRTYTNAGESPEWERSMRPYREKWRRDKMKGQSPLTHLTIKNKGKKWYETEVMITKDTSVPAVFYFFIAFVIYAIVALELYVACSG